MAKKKGNVEVHLRNREPVERMIKRFLNKVKKEKIVEDLRANTAPYIKSMLKQLGF